MTYEEMKKEIDVYIRTVKRRMILPKALKAEQLETLRCDIMTFTDANPDAVFADIVDHFGTAKSYAYRMTNDSSDEDKEKGRKQRVLVRIYIAIITVICLATVSLITFFIIKLDNSGLHEVSFTNPIDGSTQIIDE